MNRLAIGVAAFSVALVLVLDFLSVSRRRTWGNSNCNHEQLSDYTISLIEWSRPSIDRSEFVRTVHLIAAAIYAYTGLSAGQNVVLANRLIDRWPKMGRSYSDPLPNGGTIEIGDALTSMAISVYCEGWRPLTGC
jgi:hypothetical protein